MDYMPARIINGAESSTGDQLGVIDLRCFGGFGLFGGWSRWSDGGRRIGKGQSSEGERRGDLGHEPFEGGVELLKWGVVGA